MPVPSCLDEVAQPLVGLLDLAPLLVGAPPASGVVVEDHDIAGPDGNRVHVRTYTPEAGAAPRATLLEIHGGVFITGSIEMQHAFGVNVARSLGIKIAVVEYRLAPEHPYPAPLDDCYSALAWLAGLPSVDRYRVAIGGASAGGGLAAALALLARDRAEVSPSFQLLESKGHSASARAASWPPCP